MDIHPAKCVPLVFTFSFGTSLREIPACFLQLAQRFLDLCLSLVTMFFSPDGEPIGVLIWSIGGVAAGMLVLLQGAAWGCCCQSCVRSGAGKGGGVRAVCGTAARCRCRVPLLMWCCCRVLLLACWSAASCRYKVLLQGVAVRVVCAVRSWLAGAAARCRSGAGYYCQRVQAWNPSLQLQP